MTGVALVALVLGVPALVFTLWPVLRRDGRGRTFLPLPPDARQQLLERKRQVLRALRELEFEHEAGHVSDDDLAELRTRYEAEAAAILTELDRLGPRLEPVDRRPPRAAVPAEGRRSAWRHPAAVGAGAALLVLFGIALGAGIERYTRPDPMAGVPAPGSRPLATLAPAPGGPGAPEAPAEGRGRPGPAAGAPAAVGAARPLPPELLDGMLQAARSSLFAGRYGEAIAAYQAVLKRDPKNVDAMTHLGLIVALGGHTEAALEAFDKALALDPDYPPALLYRGQVLYEARHDVPGAIASWERFVKVTPPGEDRARVQRMIEEARAKR